MTDISSHPKTQQHGPNILAVTAFSNLHDMSMVTMETNGLSNSLHRPSTFLPSYHRSIYSREEGRQSYVLHFGSY